MTETETETETETGIETGTETVKEEEQSQRASPLLLMGGGTEGMPTYGARVQSHREGGGGWKRG